MHKNPIQWTSTIPRLESAFRVGYVLLWSRWIKMRLTALVTGTVMLNKPWFSSPQYEHLLTISFPSYWLLPCRFNIWDKVWQDLVSFLRRPIPHNLRDSTQTSQESIVDLWGTSLYASRVLCLTQSLHLSYPCLLCWETYQNVDLWVLPSEM